MDDALLKFGLTAFATLLVVVDPSGVLPIFIALAKNRSPRERPGGLHVVTRVLGILLAALAVQFVLNGIGEFVRLLEAGRG